jgi:hypothetical protein
VTPPRKPAGSQVLGKIGSCEHTERCDYPGCQSENFYDVDHLISLPSLNDSRPYTITHQADDLLNGERSSQSQVLPADFYRVDKSLIIVTAAAWKSDHA